jgi:hypothetical protein
VTFDRLLRLEIWALAASIVLAIASSFVAVDTLWQAASFGAVLVTAIVIVLTPALALPFIARHSDPPLAPRLSWLARLSGLAILVMGVLAARVASVPWRIAGAVVALLGAWAIVHAWRRAAKEGRTVPRDATLAFGLCAFVLGLAGGIASFADNYHTPARRYRLVMRSDLRNLMSYQDGLYDSLGRFADSVQIRQAGYRNSPRVHLRLAADSTSWSAVTSFDSSALQCFAWVGVRPRDARFSAPESESSCEEPGKPEPPRVLLGYSKYLPSDSVASKSVLVLSMYGDTSSTFKGLAVAHGLMNGQRTSVPLTVTPTSVGGVYGVGAPGSDRGPWVFLFSPQRDADRAGFVVVEGTDKGLLSNEQYFDRLKNALKAVDERLKQATAAP